MRINCHSHVFNFWSLHTLQTLPVLLDRLRRDGVPEFLIKGLAAVLRQGWAAGGEPGAPPRFLSRRAVTRVLLAEAIRSPEFADFAESAGLTYDNLPLAVRLARDQPEGLADPEATTAVTEGLTAMLSRHGADYNTTTVGDFLGFVHIGLSRHIAAVTDHLMAQLGPDDATTPLMLDVTAGGTADAARFEQHTADTSDQVLRYPGRVLPFFGVNTHRDGHLSLMETALNSRRQGPHGGHAPGGRWAALLECRPLRRDL